MVKLNVSKVVTLSGHKDCIYTLEKFKDPAIFFSGAGDGMVAEWDLRKPDQGVLVAKLKTSVYALHYHESDNTLIIGQNYQGIHVIDVESKKERASLQLTKAAIFDIQSAGNFLLVGTGDGELIVVKYPELTIVKRIQLATKSARCIAHNAVRNELAVGYSDNMIRIFDAQTMAVKHTISGHSNSVFTVAYSPDKKYLLSSGRDAHLKVWGVDEAYEQVHDIVAHMYAINHIVYSPDGKLFSTCSMDKSLKVWDAETFKLLKVIDKARHAGHGTSVNKMLWTGYDNFLISGSDDRSISVWNVEKETNEYKIK